MVRLLRNFKAKPCSFNKDEFFRVESVPAANPSSETGAKVTHLRQSRVLANRSVGSRCRR